MHSQWHTRADAPLPRLIPHTHDPAHPQQKGRAVTELGDADSSFARVADLHVHAKSFVAKGLRQAQAAGQQAGSDAVIAVHCFHGFGSECAARGSCAAG